MAGVRPVSRAITRGQGTQQQSKRLWHSLAQERGVHWHSLYPPAFPRLFSEGEGTVEQVACFIERAFYWQTQQPSFANPLVRASVPHHTAPLQHPEPRQQGCRSPRPAPTAPAMLTTPHLPPSHRLSCAAPAPSSRVGSGTVALPRLVAAAPLPHRAAETQPWCCVQDGLHLCSGPCSTANANQIPKHCLSAACAPTISPA